jgi:uncharacterized membrane protein
MDVVAILFGLLSALGFGVSDFVAGVGGRRTSVGAVLVAGQPFALLATLLALALFHGSRPTARSLAWGAVSGLGSAFGTIALYRGLAMGQMSIVAPLSGVLAALIPALVGLGLGERMSPVEAVGITLAIPAILLVSAQHRSESARSAGVIEGLAAGAAFGLFFVALDRGGTGAGAWPLVASQLVAVSIVIPVGLRMSGRDGGRRAAVPYGAMAGLTGGAASLFFLAATGTGELAVAAVLTSLYPAVTIIFARLMLDERWSRMQVAGLLMAGAAVALISAG